MTNTVNSTPTPRPYYVICVMCANTQSSDKGKRDDMLTVPTCPTCGQRLARVVRTERED